MDSCCPEMIALPYVSQMYSYSRTASAEALGLESARFVAGSGAGGSSEVLTELSGALSVAVVELSPVLVAVGLSGTLSGCVVELS